MAGAVIHSHSLHLTKTSFNSEASVSTESVTRVCFAAHVTTSVVYPLCMFLLSPSERELLHIT